MVQTWSMTAIKASGISKTRQPRHDQKKSSLTKSLSAWLTRYPNLNQNFLRGMETWDMDFCPSNEELFRRFGSELSAPHFTDPAGFWSEYNSKTINKAVCEEVKRQCKLKVLPHIGLYLDDEQIEDEDEVRTLASELIRDFGSKRKHKPLSIRFIRSNKIDKLRRYPDFLKRAKITQKNRAAIFIQSPGSKSDIHTDIGQGGAFCTGVKLWAFFPPTPLNMKLMRQSYEFEAQQDSTVEADDSFWGTHELEQGVWIVQNEGGCLYTPSEMAHAVFTMTWSVLISAHVNTAVTFVRNLKYQDTEIAATGPGTENLIKQMYLDLRDITPAKVGKDLFLQMRKEIAEHWLGIENVVRNKATKQEWKELSFAIRLIFKGADEDYIPACAALHTMPA